MTYLYRARAVMLTGYSEVARFAGLDPQQMLAGAELNALALGDPENWLPAASALALIDRSAAVSGRDDFGIMLGEFRDFASLGPVSLLLKHEATVRDILLAAVEYRSLLNDLLHMSVRDDGDTAMVEWSLMPGLGSSQGVNLLAAIAYRAISEALEARWEPDRIHFRHSKPEHVRTFQYYFRCPLEFESQFDGMSCSSSTLNRINPFGDKALASYARRLLNLLPGVRAYSDTDKVRSIVLMLMHQGHADADHVAKCLGVPVRTLQRRLTAEGSSFSTLLNDIRRELAVRHLLNSSNSLTMVAQLTGYSTLSAFDRWFIREFGTSPTIWRHAKEQGPPPQAVAELSR